MLGFKQIQVVWLGLVAGLGAYTCTAYVLLALAGVELALVPPAVMPYVAAGAVALMLAGVSLKGRMVAMIPSGLEPAQRLERYTTAVVVGLALVEGGGVLVLTLSLLAGTSSWVLIGGGLGVAMLVWSRPRREEAAGAP